MIADKIKNARTILYYITNKRAYLIIRVSSNLFMEFPKAISMQEVLKSGFRHIL